MARIDHSKKKPSKRTTTATKSRTKASRKLSSSKTSTKKSGKATSHVKKAEVKNKKVAPQSSNPKEDVSVKLLPGLRYSRSHEFEVGQYRKGKIKNIVSYGIFVGLDSEGHDGFVHVSNLAWRNITDARTAGFSVDDVVSVQILKIKDDGKIELGIKQTQCRLCDTQLQNKPQDVASIGSAATKRKIGMEYDLMHFAYVLFERYEELAKQTLKEDWTVSKNSPLGVLKSYIRYTFQRAMETDVVSVADDESAAIFNTGLVNKNYDWIYGYFEPNTKQGVRQKWFLRGFFSPGDSGDNGLGKRAIQKFGQMPPRVEWLKPERVYFNAKFDIYPDFEHIVFERIERLPMKFMRKIISEESPLCDICNEIEDCRCQCDDLHGKISSTVEKQTDSKYKRILKYRGISAFVKFMQDDEGEHKVAKLVKLVKDFSAIECRQKELYSNLQRELKTSGYDETRFEIVSQLKKAVDLAKKKTLWDYATAVPIYYPTKREFGFLLPLCLFGQKSVDVALVVSNGANGTYQGQTILTPEMAYSNARLLRRPDAQWLHQWVNGDSANGMSGA